MRVVGIDHGARRLGIAVGDTETGMAFARAAIRRRNLDADLARLVELCRSEGATLVVIGLPLHLDGGEGEQAAAARRFGAAVEEIGLEVAFEDERLTSWEARERLAAAGARASRASGEVDSTAACLILQQYLDARRPGPHRLEETE
ncbi:MAG TPA: Holliday junction resolvase RuvX [Candidatus Binatia bacterium]|nr:Holliday junction resolvase RuvX [Candidatus Binatia bacterium]